MVIHSVTNTVVFFLLYIAAVGYTASRCLKCSACKGTGLKDGMVCHYCGGQG